MVKIKMCENNLIHGTEDVYTELQNNLGDVTEEVEPCLGYCEDCANGPFLLLDDFFFKADSRDELYEAVIEKIEP